MPIEYEVFSELNIAFFRYDGVITVDDEIERFLDYMRDPLFRPEISFLVDKEHCTLPGYDYDGIRRLSYCVRPLFDVRGPTSRTAFVCPDDDTFGTSRMYQVVSEAQSSRELGVFRTREEALAFLDLPDQTASLFWPEDPGASQARMVPGGWG